MLSVVTAYLLSLLFWLALVPIHGNELDGSKLSPDVFHQRVVSGDYDVIVDVRRREDEFNLGHVPGATLVESLASFVAGSTSTGRPSDLAGCEYCDIIVYCRSGARASVAIGILRENGFKGRLWNGQGTMQWENAGYDLVTTDSFTPPCTVNQTASEECYSKFISYSGDGNLTNETSCCESNAADNGADGDGSEDEAWSSAHGRSVPSFSWWVLSGALFCLFYKCCAGPRISHSYEPLPQRHID